MKEVLTRTPIKKRVNNNTFRKIKVNWQLYLLLLIPLAYIIIFKYIPMYGAQIAFRDYRFIDGFAGSKWVGLKHFKQFINSPYIVRLLSNTVGISLYYLIVGFPIPIILALSLNEVDNKGFGKTIQTLTYAPYFISTVIIVSMLIQIFSPQMGVVNKAIEALGGEKVNFLGEPKLFQSMYVWSAVWQMTGYSSIIYIAALAGIDPSLHEAAVVDGASRLQRIWHINIPGILPTAIILLILNVGQIMNVGFEKVFLMQNPLNLSKSEVISTYVYKVGLTSGQFSFSSAVGLFNSVINCILLVTVNRISKKLGQNSLW